MITLARHIELLLLEHDCVIVPGFGGFIASHNPARYNEDGDNLFLPPYRTIAFNQNLRVNDGLLVQSYMSAYDASYPAACLQMEKEVDKMVAELDMKGECTLEGVGSLKKGMNGNVLFSSYEAGVLTPHLYGLYSLEIKSLEQLKKDAEVEKALRVASLTAVNTDGETVAATTDNDKKEKGEKKAFPRRRWIEVAVSAAAAAVLFLTIMLPSISGNNVSEDVVVAQALTTPQTPPQPSTQGEGAEKSPSSMENSVVGNSSSPQSGGVRGASPSPCGDGRDEVSDDVAPAYALVMASYVSEGNANGYIAKLAKDGFPEARYVKKGKVSRVLYAGYATEAEAYAALKELRQQSSEFKEAWVLAL